MTSCSRRKAVSGSEQFACPLETQDGFQMYERNR